MQGTISKKVSLVVSLLFVLSLIAVMFPLGQAAHATGTISVLVDGKTLSMDSPPVQENGRVLVPLRAIFEAIGASVGWDQKTSTITAKKGDTTVVLKLGEKNAKVGATTVTLDVPARLGAGNRTLVPVRFVGEAFGGNVNWDGAARRVTVSTPKDLEGSLKMSGSTSVQPIAEELAQAFMKKYPKVRIAIAGGGSGVGIKDAAEGKVNIGNSSRALRKTDPPGIVDTAIARDVLVVAVHPKNTVSNLTPEQIRAIYTGKITNWKDLGGKNAPIIVNGRTAPSGTFDFFHENFMGKDATVATAKQRASSGLVRQAVAADENAIGYISLGYIDNTVKALNISGVAPNIENARSGAYSAVRPFLMVTKGAPTGLTKEFLEYVLSEEGQKIVSKEYLPVK